MSTINHAPVISGYEINEHLYTGSRTLVYRGVREKDSLAVVIKLLASEYPSFNELLQFRNQYTISKNLDIPGIIHPLSLEAYGNGYILVMEDTGAISLREYIKTGTLSLEEILAVAIQLTNILHDLHQNRVIHKDIKPANILIHSETKQVQLIDFSIASLLPKETQEIKSPNGLEGTLAYISPEQTGRMNRGIDYRSDFYSLGVTFYELLTGELPFISDDPMELVHCHIAKMPTRRNREEVPQVLSDIVSKLMAKNAEDRYQSALGLKHDLETCLCQLKDTGKITYFEIGKQDLCDRFLIPEKLYGREVEVQALLDAFDRVANGTTEMILVAGFSGIGKTAVVNEVHKPITRQQGYFIKGKFDQFNRNIPFSAFVQALRDLMGQLLSESDTQLQTWKTKILAAVGDNGQVLIEVIPELEWVIGKQPIAPELSGSAAQNRFNLLFQKFIEVFTTVEHPLVMFLDDLQWADSASVQLIKLLMGDKGYLLLLGAYRDNEVSPVHPFILTVEELKKAGKTVNTITLAPLTFDDTNQLVADTLHCSTQRSQPLTELIDRKTKGNPFFTTQFLKALHEDGYITFNRLSKSGGWECDISQINALSLTDDVVEFMAQQLQKLPSQTQQVLKLAACIGNQFDLATLAIVSEKSEADTAAALWKALQEGLILPQTEVYKFYLTHDELSVNTEEIANVAYRFLHDRIQQAAYSLIPEVQKQSTHLKIGRLLLQNTPTDQQEEGIFAIVNQLNYGVELIAEPDERKHLSQLNLIAGCKAKNSTAYGAAVEYFKVAMDLLPINSWQSSYELTLAIYESAAEAEYLNTNFESSKSLVDILLKNAKSPLEKVRTYEIQIQSYTAQNKFIEAIATGKEALQLLDLTLPEDSNTQMILAEHQQLQQLLINQSIAALADMPEINTPKYLVALRILSGLFAPVYIAKPMLLPLKIFTMIRICIQHGNSPQAAIAYSLYGLFLCSIGAIEDGYQFGRLAVQLLDKFQTKELKSRVYLTYSLFIKHWKDAIKSTLSLFLDGLQSGLETGNLEYVGYCANCYCQFLFWSGENLENAAQEADKYCELMQQIKQEVSLIWGNIWRQTVKNLQGEAVNPCHLNGENFNEIEMLPTLIATNNINGICYVYLAKSLLAYLFGEYESAWEYSQKFEQYEQGAAGLLIVPLRNFYQSLSLLALCHQANEAQQQLYLQKVAENQAKMQEWAHHAPVNYQHKYNLIVAEQARITGNKLQAADYYEMAIQAAIANGYVQEAAIANELAAKFYFDWNKEKVAQAYMQEAYYCYARWGAKAKTNDLEQRYPQLLKPILQQRRLNLNPFETIATITRSSTSRSTHTSTTGSSSISDILDFTSVIKAAQAISSSIELEELIINLTRIILENSGAKKTVLILIQENTCQVRAITFISHKNKPQGEIQSILVSESTDTCKYIPRRIINYVKNTQETVVIDNCQTDIPGLIGQYMLENKPKSVLCTPIINQGHLVGILYLENQQTSGVFTSDRLSVINLLCTQAAISLEKAQLYTNLQASEARFLRLAENAPGMIYQFQLSPEGMPKFNYISPGCYGIYEVSPHEVVTDANKLLSLTHPEDIAHYQETVEISAQTLQPWQYQGRIITPSGKVKWIQAASRPVKQTDGTIIWDGLLLDITERKQAEAAVKQKSQELENALQDLQQAQLQIIQNEKMSALGNLVAGVAHEMNNPLGFIFATLKQAKPIVADISEHLKLYQVTLPNPSKEIIEHAAEIDLDYSLEDLPKMIDAMVMACDRLQNISTSLRTFSRADKDYKVAFNIHEGIDSTILILKHRLKANEQRPAIEVVTEYGKLPQIECFPGQLNQVFMNILANAIDALDEASTGRTFEDMKANPHRITVKTSVENNNVKISIADNGEGMSEDVKNRIFDHLFTTKGVGKGTGLGLAIARQIVVEKHGGTIEVNSVLGEGTEFVISLPMKGE